MAFLLGKRKDKRNAIFSDMRKAYNYRSRIVHGTQVRITPQQVQQIGEVVRKSIMWFMNHKEYANHDKIIDLMDLA